MTLMKKLRCQNKLSQRDVARKVDISAMAYNRYETYQRIPNACVALRIAKILQSSVEELWGHALQAKPA